MTSVSAAHPSPTVATAEDDILHLLFNNADGILVGMQQQTVVSQTQDIPFEAAPSVDRSDSLSPPGDSNSNESGGSGSGCSFWSGDDLQQFDLDSFLSSVEAATAASPGLGHAAYDLDLPPLPGGDCAGGGPLRPSGGNKRRKQRQLSQLPYSIGDIADGDELDQQQRIAWDDDDDDLLGGDDFGQLGNPPEGQPGEPLQLTAEEARVARQLGVSLPARYPLTREEAKVLRTVRRKIRNKISAKNSRAKKQEYVRGLEQRVKGSAVENSQLRDRCAGLEQQNRRLMGAVRRLQAFLRSSGLSLATNAGKATGTGFFILCLSFALFLTPQLSPFLTSGGDPAAADAALRPASGRRILQAAAPQADLGAKLAPPPPPESAAAQDSLTLALEPGAAPTNASDGGESTSITKLDAPASSDAPLSAPAAAAAATAASSSPQSAEDDSPPREQDLTDRDL